MEKRLLLAMMGGFPSHDTASRLLTATERNLASPPFLPDPILYNQAGKPVRFFSDLMKGKVVIINMMYTMCKRMCPMNIKRLREVQTELGDRMGRDVRIYSLTLRPEEDSSAALAEYADQYDVGPGWSFLTGRPRDIDSIRRKLGFFNTDPVVDADLANHTSALHIGNVGQDRWMMMPDSSAPATQVISAINAIC